jgi:hypothetical protein
VPPDSLCRPEMVSARDEWHRRKILRLQGNTYMNIFALSQLTGRSVGIYSSSIKNLFKSTSVGKITLYFKKLHTKLIDTTESL